MEDKSLLKLILVKILEHVVYYTNLLVQQHQNQKALLKKPQRIVESGLTL